MSQHITSGKGGVGKTTATANLGVALAAGGPASVCIDADIGLRNLDVVMGLENRIVYDLVDVIEGRCKLRQALIKDKRLSDLYLIPAAQTRDKTAVSPQDMIRVAEELRAGVRLGADQLAGRHRARLPQCHRPGRPGADRHQPGSVSAVRDADRIIGLMEAEEKGPRQADRQPRQAGDGQARRYALAPTDILDVLAIELIGMVPEDEIVDRGHQPGQTGGARSRAAAPARPSARSPAA